MRDAPKPTTDKAKGKLWPSLSTAIHVFRWGAIRHKAAQRRLKYCDCWCQVLRDCASVIAIFRASVVINSVWVRSFRCRLRRTTRLMQTQT